jgi:sortase A
MGYIEIPEIDVSLPIYHGTEDPVLQVAIGHLEWSSLPVGGESTHCVLSGHRGLPSAKLFTDLDKLREGDTFLLRVLDEILTYEVDQILIVEPQDTAALEIVEGEDYCTLVTCTPYGINTHRLLVRGHRIDNIEEVKTVRVTADAVQLEPMLVAPVVAVPMLLILLILLLLPRRRKK